MNKYLLLLILIFNTYIYSYDAVLFNGQGLTNQDRLLAMTIAGIVNRDSARLYLLNVYETWSYTSTDEAWRDIYKEKGNVTFEEITGISNLVNRFKSYFKGAITYDNFAFYSNFSGQAFLWQGEFAAMLGGLTDRIPLTASQASALGLNISDSILIEDKFDGDASIWVTGKVDAASNPWMAAGLTTEQRYLAMLNYGIEKVLPRCNPGKFYIREITDYAVQNRMFQVNLAGTDDLDFNSLSVKKADVLENLLNYFHNKNLDSIFHIYGWIRPEPMVQWFSCFGASFHETLLSNLSFHHKFPVPEFNYVPKANINPDTLEVQNKYYLIFVTTEGDASNWAVGLQSGAWLSPNRGNVAINWGWNLQLFEEFPFLTKYYYETATKNDGFVSVITPLGYSYPDLFPNESLEKAKSATKSLMKKFNIADIYGYKHYAGSGIMTYRGKTINNSYNFTKYGNFQNDIGAAISIVYDPMLSSQKPITTYKSLLFNHTGDNSFYGEALDLDAMAARIITNIKKQTKPGFLMAGYQRLRQEDFANRIAPGSSDMSVSRLEQVVNKIKQDPTVGADVEVVTIETFSALIRKKLGLLDAKEDNKLPLSFNLYQNYPNPFNPSTTIKFSLAEKGNVELKVYNLMGEVVSTLVDEYKEAGEYEIHFNGNGLTSGIYFYTLKQGMNSVTNKMILIK